VSSLLTHPRWINSELDFRASSRIATVTSQSIIGSYIAIDQRR
jgi:hypothetical protein